MSAPRTIGAGLGISFYFNPKRRLPPPQLSVAAAGAEFNEASLFRALVGEIVFPRVRP